MSILRREKMSNNLITVTGGGIHHTFIFVPFGSTISQGSYFNIFNDDEDCGNIRKSLERCVKQFNEVSPYVNAVILLCKGENTEPVFFELYDYTNRPTKNNPTSFRPTFRKGIGYYK